MTQQIRTPILLAALGFGLGCTNAEPLSPLTVKQPVFERGPADGNGNKNVLLVDLVLPAFTTCPNGAILDLRVVGWEQERHIDHLPMGVLPFHFNFIYSNAAGQTYVWQQTGVQRFYRGENGDTMLSVGGRVGYDATTGHMVIDITTGEVVSVTGKQTFAEDLACAALT